jgi:uncharacterized membrane protein YfcA
VTNTLGAILFLFSGASVAGFFGALLGVGGGLFIVPMLVLILHLPMKAAVAASIVSVIATSNAGGSRYVEQGITNVKVAMFLEMFTTTGAIIGGLLAFYLQEWVMLLLFALLMVNMAYSAFKTRKLDDQRIASGAFANAQQDRLCKSLDLHGSYYDQAAVREVPYVVTGAGVGASVSLLAGLASGMLGVGGGVLKVAAMNRYMNIPMKVAVATSKLMIGVTAAVSSTLFFFAGVIPFTLVGPIALGTTCGATIGSRVMNRIQSSALKKLLVVLVLYTAYSMVVKALRLRFGIALPHLG